MATPVRPETVPEGEDALMAAEHFKGRNSLRVLVCDDDPALLDLMARRLEKLGLTVEKASAGGEASTRLSQRDYDLLVTDIYMPDVTGLDLLRQFKAKDPRGQVVVATASATLESAIEAMNHGAFAYLTKPFDHISVFDNVVSRAIDFRKLLRANQRMAEVQRRRGDMLEDEVASRIQKLKGQHQYLAALVGSLPIGIVVYDEKGRAVLANPVAERLLGAEIGEPAALLERLTTTLPVQDGKVQGPCVLAGGQAHVTIVDLQLDEERLQKILVLAGEDEAAAGQGTMLIQALGQLRRGLAWLARQPFDGEAGTIVKAVLQQMREVERLAGLSVSESELPALTGEVPTPKPALTAEADVPKPPPIVEASAPKPAPERQLLARGRAFLRRKEDIPEPPTRPGTGSLPRPEDAARSLQRWAQSSDVAPKGPDSPDDHGDNGRAAPAGNSAGAWPPPLPTRPDG
jgi:DNA-binding response OmpR family regulator